MDHLGEVLTSALLLLLANNALEKSYKKLYTSIIENVSKYDILNTETKAKDSKIWSLKGSPLKSTEWWCQEQSDSKVDVSRAKWYKIWLKNTSPVSINGAISTYLVI